MATKKAKQTKKTVPGETPITIGGGGLRAAAFPLTIQYVVGDWVSTPGLLTLVGGNVKRIKISTDDYDIKLPVNGAINIDLKCGKP